MTREQAISAAREFNTMKQYSVEFEPTSVRLMEASRFNDLFGQVLYPCDFWAIDFVKIFPPGEGESNQALQACG